MRLHLIDGTWELFRAHFSKRPGHEAPDGSDRKATVGVVRSLLALLSDPAEQVTHVAAAFDNPLRSFRNELFDGYKTDAGVPKELLAQLDAVEDAVAALGVTVWSMRELEADDALATAAARFAGQVDQVRLCSPDKDLGQCLSGTRVVQLDRLRQRVIDEEELRRLRGVGPASIPDFLALWGDAADGIPGVPGFGEKTAAALLAVYGHVEQIPRAADEWTVRVRGAAQLAANLAAHEEPLRLYKQLATVRTDAELPQTLDQLAWRGVPRRRFTDFCARLGAASLATAPRRWDESG